MGRTLPSFTQLILDEQNALAKFRRALRREDQAAFDDLFRAARYHVAACAYASHLLPFETMLLAMLIQEHQRVRHLEILLEQLLEREAHDYPGRMDPGRLPLPPGHDGLDD